MGAPFFIAKILLHGYVLFPDALSSSENIAYSLQGTVPEAAIMEELVLVLNNVNVDQGGEEAVAAAVSL